MILFQNFEDILIKVWMQDDFIIFYATFLDRAFVWPSSTKKFALFLDVGQICSPSPRDEMKDIEAKNDAASLQSERKINTRTRDRQQGVET